MEDTNTSKSTREYIEADLDNKELSDLICMHARSKNGNIAKPFLMLIAELRGMSSDRIDKITSSFEYYKDDKEDWAIEEPETDE